MNSNMSSLDVQFGCLEFGTDGGTFDAGVESVKYSQSQSANASTTADVSQQVASLSYSNTPPNSQQSTLVAGLTSKSV